MPKIDGDDKLLNLRIAKFKREEEKSLSKQGLEYLIKVLKMSSKLFQVSWKVTFCKLSDVRGFEFIQRTWKSIPFQ